MCFSAGASFAAGGVLSAIGIATVKEVQKPSQRLFAIIPIFFGIQQLTEGCLWLALQSADHLVVEKISTYIFLITAQIFWPVIIPLSVFLMEDNREKKKILKVFFVSGILLSLYYAFYLFFHDVTSQSVDCHILYVTESPESLALPTFIIYLILTIVPLFISGNKRMSVMGILMALSCLATAVFYKLYLTSVWCFFAAIISATIYWILRKSKNAKED
ncbi:MAG TPA: hypothetical protein PLR88_01890 [Bacteroidales bacterium]|nr:hypothetical protein [Bacteroidales bacterium]HPT20671.1 hypothetical protein [Bacteroidales bacterium]